MMNPQSIKTLLIFLFGCSLNLFAQDNFVRGYIITNEKDTIHGLIDFRTDAINSSVCRYKVTEEAPAETFYPGDIYAYRYAKEGKFYVSREIEVEGNSKWVFLEYLIDGIMNAYYYSSGDASFFFFENEEGNLYALSKKEDELRNNKLIEDKKYIGALAYIFRDNPEMNKSIKNSSYDKKSMLALSKQYHELTCEEGEECIVFENDYKKQYSRFDFSIYTGLSTIAYEINQITALKDVTTYTFSPIIGGSIDLSFPRHLKELSIYLDASFFATIISKDSHRKVGSNESYYISTSVLKKSALTSLANFGFKYSSQEGKIRPVFAVGASLAQSFCWKEEGYIERTKPIDSSISFREEKYNAYNTSLGYAFALGLNYVRPDKKIYTFRVTCDIMKFNYAYPQEREASSPKKISQEGDMMNIFQAKIGYIF